MDKKKYLIIFSAGLGLEMEGKDILQVSIERFVMASPEIKVIVVLPSEAVKPWSNYCAARNFFYPQIIIPAAFTPFHSIKKALEKVPKNALVAVHDGSRPFVRPSWVATLFEAATRDGYSGVVPVMPCPDRSRVYSAAEGLKEIPFVEGETVLTQFPQVFLSDVLKEAYSQPYDLTYTDPASVALKMNAPLSRIEGERCNIIVSSADDLSVGRLLWKQATAARSS